MKQTITINDTTLSNSELQALDWEVYASETVKGTATELWAETEYDGVTILANADGFGWEPVSEFRDFEIY